MTTEEQLKIFAAYLPYELMFCSNGGKTLKYAWKLRGIKTDDRYPGKPTLLSERDDYKNIINIWSPCAKPILYSMDRLTKKELYNADFENHVDWLTNEREALISRYGIEDYLNKTPFGHIQYLLSKHYNIFGIPAGDFIDKATLKTESND